MILKPTSELPLLDPENGRSIVNQQSKILRNSDVIILIYAVLESVSKNNLRVKFDPTLKFLKSDVIFDEGKFLSILSHPMTSVT